MQKPHFSILGLDHIVLRVGDIGRAMAFYCDILGCRKEREVPSLGLFQLRAGSALIDLVDVQGELGQRGGKAPDSEKPNMDHFCLRIEPFDEERIVDHLRSAGIRTGDIGRRYGADGFGPSLYITDPDGNTVELKGPPEARKT
jgi:glyoxylase I family protein